MTTDTAIFERVLTERNQDWTAEMARWFARVQLTEADRQRVGELLEKNQARVLDEEEQEALQNYERVEHFLAVLRAQARLTMKRLDATR